MTPNEPPTLLVIYHSMTDGTRQMVQACTSAAGLEPGVRVSMKLAADVGVQDVLNANGYVFATPEYLGSMSGIMKDFFDRTYYHVIDKVQGRPYAIMICAGSDGQGAARQIERIVNGWRLKAIAAPVIINVAAQTSEKILARKRLPEEGLKPCSELGQLFAAGISVGLF